MWYHCNCWNSPIYNVVFTLFLYIYVNINCWQISSRLFQNLKCKVSILKGHKRIPNFLTSVSQSFFRLDSGNSILKIIDVRIKKKYVKVTSLHTSSEQGVGATRHRAWLSRGSVGSQHINTLNINWNSQTHLVVTQQQISFSTEKLVYIFHRSCVLLTCAASPPLHQKAKTNYWNAL